MAGHSTWEDTRARKLATLEAGDARRLEEGIAAERAAAIAEMDDYREPRVQVEVDLAPETPVELETVRSDLLKRLGMEYPDSPPEVTVTLGSDGTWKIIVIAVLVLGIVAIASSKRRMAEGRVLADVLRAPLESYGQVVGESIRLLNAA